jgi:deazaflavin-dependent oxidoreductase (nitroreductase family)
MAEKTTSTHVPWFVSFFNPIARRLLAAGVPMGPNVLLTVRGRKSGVPRTTPVAIVEISGRRWLMAPFGNVNWVQNLRAAGQATIALGRRQEAVRAVELGPEEAVAFYRDILTPQAQQSRVAAWIVRNVDGVDISDPVAAARGRPIFEILSDAGKPLQ